MTAYAISYRCAYDNYRLAQGRNTPPHETILIAPSGWEADEVIEAFINQRPGSTVISCTAAPLPQL